MRRPLEGLRAVSLAHQYPGPYATALLADLGMDVVLVERPDGGDPARAFPAFHGALARGKRSAALDLTTPSGHAALIALATRADVLLEGFRPGAMARLGLAYEDLARVNPDLVYVSVSGYGQDGPYRSRPGHDVTYQAEAGMLHELLPDGDRRPEDPPPAPSLALGDLTAGLLAVQGALLGLVRRERGDGGTHVDVSMFDGLVSLLTAHLGPVVNDSGQPGFPYEPGYGIFRTGDDAYLALGVAHEDRFWRALCEVTGLNAEADLAASERLAQRARLHERLAAAIRGRSLAEWARAFEDADVPFGQVRDLDEVPCSPQARARELFHRVPGADGAVTAHVRQPLRVNGVAPGPSRGVPRLGEHTAEVLAEAQAPADVIAAVLRGDPGPIPDPAGR